MRRKVKYLTRVISNFFQKRNCPNCNHTDLEVVDQKYFVTYLFRCNNCHLQHRHPKDDAKWLDKYYQSEYKIDTHMMTDLPSNEEIVIHKKENFKSIRGYDKYINALFGDGPVNILDYGCSWGYNVFKLQNSGYNAVGFELSEPRARFGKEKLEVEIFSDIDRVPKDLDLFMSSHVIEHLIDLPKFISFGKSCLKEDGVFMAFCPNGNPEYREREPTTWHGSWGDIHVNLIDLQYAMHTFKDNPYLILSGDWVFNAEEIENWDGLSQKVGSLKNGKELLIITKPNTYI